MKLRLNTIEEYDAHCRKIFQQVREAFSTGIPPEDLEIEFSPEVQAEVDRRRQKQEAWDRLNKIGSLRLNWGAPKRHFEKVVDPHDGWDSARKSLLRLLGKGMLVGLVGGRGTGKTQLAVELMKEKTEQLKSALFCSAMQFFIDVKSTYGEASRIDESGVLNRYQRASLLVIDEVGKRGGSDWENNLLFELINRRYNDGADTILIDNRTKAEFIETIGPSLASRMNECGGIVECNWESFRQ